MVFAYHYTQSDLPLKKRGAFEKMFNMFDNDESRTKGIFCFKLQKCDIKRSDILGYIIDKFEQPERQELMFPV